MTRHAAFLLVAVSFCLCSSPPAGAQTIYRWRDAGGGLHFSNQTEHAPNGATVAELPTLGSIQIPASAKRARRSAKAHVAPAPPLSPCGPADPTGLAHAIALGLPSAFPP